MEKKMTKKGALGEIFPALLIFLVAAVMIGIGVFILDKIQTATGLTADAVTTINATKQSYATFGTVWFPILVIVLGAVLVIALLLSGFSRQKLGR